MLGYGPISRAPLSSYLPGELEEGEEENGIVLNVTLEDTTLVSTVAVAVQANLSVTLEDATLASTVDGAIAVAVTVILDDAVLVSSVLVQPALSLNVTLDDATVESTVSLAGAINLSVTLDDATLEATFEAGPIPTPVPPQSGITPGGGRLRGNYFQRMAGYIRRLFELEQEEKAKAEELVVAPEPELPPRVLRAKAIEEEALDEAVSLIAKIQKNVRAAPIQEDGEVFKAQRTVRVKLIQAATLEGSDEVTVAKSSRDYTEIAVALLTLEGLDPE